MTKNTYRQTDSLSLSVEQLNAREAKVLATLTKAAAPMPVKVMARTCFPGQRCKPGTYGTETGGGTAVAYRCTLNSVRRLVAGGFVKKVAKGTYQAVQAPAAVVSANP